MTQPDSTPPSISPVADLDTSSHAELTDGIGLCLSGGGFRAMLFHVGAVWRLNELGLLGRLDRVSSVSGGSITAGVLGMNWKKLDIRPDQAVPRDRFEKHFVAPLRGLADHTLDLRAVGWGTLLPGVTISDKIIAAYRKHLFRDATLQDLPDTPRFVINATNVQSGALWRFMKPYMRDYRVGEVKKPRVSLAECVAASSAFPPFLSPVSIELDPQGFTPNSGMDLQFPPFTSEVVLTDGGVYDNLGLETVWKRYRTVLVSDGGGKMDAEAEPQHNWGGHIVRVLNLIDNQVRSVRKRQLIDSYQHGERTGTYWGIRTDIRNYGLSDALPCDLEKTRELARTPTRLAALSDAQQERLIDWGYAVCDAALRCHAAALLPTPPPKPTFPYGGTGVAGARPTVVPSAVSPPSGAPA